MCDKKTAMNTRFLIVACALAVPAAEARPYKDLCEQFEPLRKMSGFKYVKPEITIQPKTPGVRPEDVVFTIEAKAGAIKVSPKADGALELPMDPTLCAENPNFETNQPKGSVDINVSIDPKIPPAKQVDYKTLEALRAEWKEALSRQSFMYRMLAPSSKGYEIDFEPGRGGVAEVRLPTGVRTFTANTKGEVRIPFEDAWIASNPAIVFDAMPKRIGLAFD